MAKSSSPPPSRGPKPAAREIEPAPEGSDSPAPFDFDRLQQLMELMEKHGLSEVTLRKGHEQWRLRRGSVATTVVSAPQVMHAAPAVAAAPAPAPVASSAPAVASSAAADAGLLVIKSPTVGTFYSAQTPEDPPFVSVGGKVTPATTVCLIEAMKVFNPIAAEISGTIEAVLVKNGDAVEFGQPLFKVRP